MTKSELIALIAEKTGVAKTDSERSIDALQDIIINEISKGNEVTLPKMGKFSRGFRAARKGRNPQTGAEIQIKESYTAKFKSSKSFKDSLN